MTSLAAPGRLRGVPPLLAVIAIAATTAAAFLVFPVPFVVAGLLAVTGGVAILLRPEAGLAAVAVFTVLRLPEVATEFHGAPSLFAPLAALVVLALVVRGVHAGAMPAGGVAAALAVTGFAAVAALSLLASDAAGDAIGPLRGVFEDGAVAVLVGLLLSGTASLRRLVWAVVIGGGAVAALSVVQYLTASFHLSFGGLAQSAVQNIVGATDDVRISGPVGDPNFYAQWMLMVVPLAADRFWDETHRWWRLVAATCGLVAAIAVVLTFSRGGLLGLGVVGALLLVRRPPRLRTVAAVALLAVIALPLLPPGYTDRLATLTDVGSVGSGVDPSLRSRTAEALAAARMFTSDPVTGVGYGTFADRYLAFTRDLGIDLRATGREAHNLYLQFAAEMGVPGVLLLAGLTAGIGVSVRRGRRRFRSMSDFTGDGIGFAVGVALIGFAVTSAFLHLAFARLPWLLVGIALALPGVAAWEDEHHELAAAGVER